MPEILGDPIIRHAWRPRGDPQHIHYLAISGDHLVHLRAAVGERIYPVLDDALTRQGDAGISRPGRVEGGVPPLSKRHRVRDEVARVAMLPVTWARQIFTER